MPSYIPTPAPIPVNEFYCPSNGTNWIIVNFNYVPKVIIVKCGNDVAQLAIRLKIPPRSNSVVCFRDYYRDSNLPANVVVMPYTSTCEPVPEQYPVPFIFACNNLWMKFNLNVDTYRNGDPIPEITDGQEWVDATYGAWCHHPSDPTGYYYGKLYNWYAVNDPRGLAPEGWRIPTAEDFYYLSFCSAYGRTNTTCNLRAVGEGFPSWPRINCSNGDPLGFRALPAEYRHGSFFPDNPYPVSPSFPPVGGFENAVWDWYTQPPTLDGYVHIETAFWTSEADEPVGRFAKYGTALANDGSFIPNPFPDYAGHVTITANNITPNAPIHLVNAVPKNHGFSVRCVAVNPRLPTTTTSTTTSTTTTTTIPVSCCKIVLPLPRLANQDMSIGTTIVTPTYTGPTLPNYTVYAGPNCTLTDMPDRAATLGYTPGTFTYTLNFSEPTTQVALLAYGGGGIKLFGDTVANFTFNTNGTNTSISFCTRYNCRAQTARLTPTSRPTILKLGDRRGTRGVPGSAFVIVEATTPFTQLTISGDGIGGGASFAICDRLWPVTTTTTTIPGPKPCTLKLETLTNTSNIDAQVSYFADERIFSITTVLVPANSSVQVCSYRIVYVPPTVTYIPSSIECCSTTTTTSTTSTTTTTTAPPCNTWQATFIGQNGGTASFDYTDCDGIVHSPIVGLGIPALPTSIQFCALGLPIGNPQIQIIQIAADQCSTTTSTTSTTSTTTTTTIPTVCNTYQAIYNENVGNSNLVYIDCNGVQQTITLGGGTPLYPSSTQFCALQIISTGPLIFITQIANNQCSTTTTSTSTTTTTIAPCDAYTVVQNAVYDMMPLVSYINCNGVLSYTGGFSGTGYNTPHTFCAQSIVNVPSIYQVTLLHNGCTTTTTTCAPIGDCQRQCIEDTIYLYTGFTIPGQSPITFTNYTEACNGLDFIVNHNNTGLQLSTQTGYGGNDHYTDPIYAYPNSASMPELCELISDGWYIWATMFGNIYIQGTSLIVNVVNGVFQSVQGSCGNCVPYSVPVEKECNYQLIERGVPQADFTSSITSACAAVDTVLQWPLFNDPMELQILSETAKAYSWEIGYSVYKTTSVNNPPCLDRWTKNGYFVTNWTTGEITEIRNGGIISITNCAGFTTTTTTTCSTIPSNTALLMNTISYDGGVTFQSFTTSLMEACASRENYINALGQSNILVNIAGIPVLVESITVNAPVYLQNAADCTEVSTLTGYFLLPATISDNRIIHVVNGIIIEILICPITTTTTICPVCAGDEITIGTQIWKRKNLDVTQYANGDPITEITNVNDWANATEGAFCYYNNDSANNTVYGKLYNWYAVTDPRGLAPTGWRVPTLADFTLLQNFIGGTEIDSVKLKECGTTHWTTNNSGNDVYCFTGLPAGIRGANLENVITGIYTTCDGIFRDLQDSASFWSTNTFQIPNGEWIGAGYLLYSSSNYLNGNPYGNQQINFYKNVGAPVRLIKDHIRFSCETLTNFVFANNLYIVGEDPETGTIFTGSKAEACDAMNTYLSDTVTYSITAVSVFADSVEIDSQVFLEDCEQYCPNGWYFYSEPDDSNYIVHVLNGVIVEITDNNVNPVPDTPTLINNVDFVANDFCGSKSITFKMVNLPNGATDLLWQSPFGTLVDSGIDENDNHFATFTYEDSVTFVPTRVYGIREGSCPGDYLQILYTFSSCG